METPLDILIYLSTFSSMNKNSMYCKELRYDLHYELRGHFCTYRNWWMFYGVICGHLLLSAHSEINLEHTSLINLSHNYLSTYGGKFSAEEFMAMHMNIMNRYVFSLILFIKPHRVHCTLSWTGEICFISRGK